MIIDLSLIDTTPGADHWAAPEKPVDNYLKWYAWKVNTDKGAGQYHAIIVMRWKKRGVIPEFKGIYADELKDAIIKRLRDR